MTASKAQSPTPGFGVPGFKLIPWCFALRITPLYIFSLSSDSSVEIEVEDSIVEVEDVIIEFEDSIIEAEVEGF